ncbi:MAG TPA: hypothetical protein ENJ55_05485 [Rhizobiales bacterium]|nr:hypothetical protein [Hyphomicrobiales bacterium]
MDQVQSYCPDNPLQILALEDCTGDAAPPHPFDVPESGNNTIAFLQHSSGTTGVKKGVMLSHDQIDLQIKACAQSLDLGPKDRIVSWLPLYHDMGLIACFVLPLALGIEVTYLDPFRWVARPHSLFDAIGRHRGTLVWLPNFAFRHLVRAVPASGGSFDLSSIRAFVNCSEPCLNETLEEFVRTFEPMGVHAGQMSCSYAMAETVFSVSQTPPGQPVMKVEVDRDALAMDGACLYPHKGTRQRQWLASSGRPLNGVEIRVIDEKGKAVADGCCGAIQIRCPFMFTGYFRDQAKTTRAFDGDWYITRDRGFLHQGEVFVLGRIDDLIISNGRNFHAHEIEQIVSGIPGVISGRVAAFGHFSRTAGSHVLVILAETDFDRANQDSSSITRMISQRVFDVLNISPHDVVMLPPKTVIKTTSGKIHRTANKQLYEEGKLKSWNQPD